MFRGRFYFHLSSRKAYLTVLTVGVLLVLATLALGARTLLPRGKVHGHTSPLLGATRGASSADQPVGGPVQLVRFTLYDVDIRPREAHVRKGRVILLLEDMTGTSGGLVVEREEGNSRIHVGDVRRADDRRGKGDLRLEPGRYRVYDSGRPANEAVLVVEP